MTSPQTRLHQPPQRPLSLQRRLRRALVRMRTSPFSVPVLLLLGLRRADGRTHASGRQLDCGPGHHAAGLCPAAHPGLPARLSAGFLRVTSPGLASLLLPIDAFDTNTHQVMGRRVAGSSFAQGLAASLKPGDQLNMFTGSREALPALRALLQPVLTPGAQVKLCADLDPALISRSGCLHLPDPGLHHWCWLRAEEPASRFSLTGVTHTLCSHRVMQGLEQLVTAPLEPWDALVCTSRSALQVVQAAMTCMHERLERRFQQTLPLPQGPQLPLIPLGINPEPFHWRGRFANRQEQRLQARQQLGLSSCARVVLFLGRLSFHSKAHPLPLYRALDRLSADHEVVLLECGHIFNADIAAAYDQLQQHFPNLVMRRLGGLQPQLKRKKACPGSGRPVLFSRRQPAGNIWAERA